METKTAKNITEYLFEFAGKLPDKPILLHPEKVTYGNFCSLVDAYAFGFGKLGISSGMKTIVLIKPGADLFATIFALLRIGAVPVLIDPGMGIKAMINALSKVGAKAFVGIPKTLLLKYIFPKEFKSVKIWVSTGFCWFLKCGQLSSFRKNRNGKYKVAEIKAEDEVAIFFTSGSTGLAKGVVYQNYILQAQINYLKTHFEYTAREIDLCTFPLIGLLSMCHGLSVVLADMDMTHPAKLKPEKLVQNIKQFGCTFMFCSPMVLKKLAGFGNQQNLKLPSLKKIMTAGAPVSQELLQSFNRIISAEAEIHTPYGATEALPITDINHKELLNLYETQDGYFHGICVGYPLSNIDLRIIKITDSALPKWENAEEITKGEVGEIVIRGDNVTQSYLKNKQADNLSKIEDSVSKYLWHRTGDLGRLDKKGRVWFFGRKSQRVEPGEQTLFTVPTEAIFNQHPAVERSALIGITKNNKTLPVICIQLKQGHKKSKRLTGELSSLAQSIDFTQSISNFLFYKKLPVDPRHNAKIYREKLALWAQKKS